MFVDRSAFDAFFRQDAVTITLLVMQTLAIPIGVLMIISGLSMKQDALRLVRFSAGLGFVPLTPAWLITLPLGIYILRETAASDDSLPGTDKPATSGTPPADSEHPLSAAMRFAMTPQPGYGRVVGVPMLILTALYIITVITITFAVPPEMEAVHLLTMTAGTLLIPITLLVLHLRWAVTGKERDKSGRTRHSDAPGRHWSFPAY